MRLASALFLWVVILYYITDRMQLGGSDSERVSALLACVANAAAAGVDYIQLREKDLGAGRLLRLARELQHVIRKEGGRTRLLINARLDVALAAGVEGVHLTSNDISPETLRSISAAASRPRRLLISAACHTVQDVRDAGSSGADLALLAPIFGKRLPDGSELPGIGLEPLAAAAQLSQSGELRTALPVLALGGVNFSNAAECLAAGAAGIASIRMFQRGNVAETVSRLRSLTR